MFINGKKVIEISGTLDEPATDRVRLSEQSLRFGMMWERPNNFTPSYPVKIFVASRRAFPVEFFLSSNCEQLCAIHSFQEVFRLDENTPNDGQLRWASARRVRRSAYEGGWKYQFFSGRMNMLL